MNIVKKLAALMLAVVAVFTVAGCHPKDEVAVTIGEWKFTSAYYLCAFLDADMEAQQKAVELIYSGEAEGVDASNIEEAIYDVKIDGKKYETWVRDTALDTLKSNAAYKTLCKKNKLEISKEDKAGAEALIKQEWEGTETQSGVSALYEANGVSEKTYTQYRLDDYLAEVYFGHLYDVGGSKAPSSDEIKTYLNENYVLINVIGEDLSSLEDEAKTEKKTKINEYYTALTEGTKSFEEIYKEHNNITSDTTEDSTDDTAEENAPMDKYASFVSKENGGDHFKSIMEMSVGEIKILNGEDDSDILLVVKKDVNEDPYYLEEYDRTIRHALKDDAFQKEIDKCKKSLKVDENTYATKRFKAKKIDYLETEA